jgi:hypothetical protein
VAAEPEEERRTRGTRREELAESFSAPGRFHHAPVTRLAVGGLGFARPPDFPLSANVDARFLQDLGERLEFRRKERLVIGGLLKLPGIAPGHDGRA